MDMTDHEITEDFGDVTAYAANLSTPRTRHPKGDSPLLQSTTKAAANQLSEPATQEQPESRILSNSRLVNLGDLSRLMDILDGGDPPPEPTGINFDKNENSRGVASFQQSHNSTSPSKHQTRDSTRRNGSTSPNQLYVDPMKLYNIPPQPPSSRSQDAHKLESEDTRAIHGSRKDSVSAPQPYQHPTTSTPPLAPSSSFTNQINSAPGPPPLSRQYDPTIPNSGLDPHQDITHSNVEAESTTSAATSEAGSVSPSVRARSTSLRAQELHSMRQSRNYLTNGNAENEDGLDDGSDHGEESRWLGKDDVDGSLPHSVLEELGLLDLTSAADGASRYSLGTTPMRPNRRRPQDDLTQDRRVPSMQHPLGSDSRQPWSNGSYEAKVSISVVDSGVEERAARTQVPDEALEEFEQIVNGTRTIPRAAHSTTQRPRSRLRDIASPMPQSPEPHEMEGHLSGTDDEEIKRGVETSLRWREQMDRLRNAAAQGQADENESRLNAELKEAHEYIEQLQSEVENVSGLVMQLKAGRDRDRARFEEYSRLQPPLSEEEQAELAVARHLIALLPSLTSITPPTRSSLPKNPNSLALAVTFTRVIDSLIQNGPETIGDRRDEVVFTQDNVEKMVKRLRKWGKGRQRSTLSV